MDKLSMELGKMADTRDSVFYSMFCIRETARMRKKTKMSKVKTVKRMKKTLMTTTQDLQV